MEFPNKSNDSALLNCVIVGQGLLIFLKLLFHVR